MFSILETVLLSVKKHQLGALGDAADRLNHQYSVVILLLLALVVCAKQYVGEPIQCWLPNEYRHTWEEYVETYCFIESTYFVPLEDRVVEQMRLAERNYKPVSYYQWVPIVLALQAALFYTPHALWKAFSDLSGIKLAFIMKLASESPTVTKDRDRTDHVRLLAQQIRRSLYRQRRWNCLLLGRRWTGGRLSSLYLFHKCLYVANVIGQFLILNSFLNTDYDRWLWGWKILNDLTSSNSFEWTYTGHFPRLTICNYPIRRKSETAWESTQCVLMINMLNEKIFIFLYFWLAFVTVISLGNLFWTFWTVCRLSSACRSIEDYLAEKVDKKSLKRFVTEFLTVDGCLVLNFIQHCGDEVLNAELTEALFEMFIQCDRHQCLIVETDSHCEEGSDFERGAVPYSEISEKAPLRGLYRKSKDEEVKLYCIDEQDESDRKMI